MKIKLCVSVVSAFLLGWLLVCGLSALAQEQDLNVPGNVNLQYAPDHPGPYAYQINGNNVLRVYQTASNGSNLNLGIGAGALSKPTGSPNIFVGNFAGSWTTNGNGNTAAGYGAGSNNATGASNTYIGFEAAGIYASGQKKGPPPQGQGSSNTFLGSTAGFYITLGKSNAFLGSSAGYRNTEGSSNVFIGDSAGYYNQKGSNNIYLSTWGPQTDESGTIRIGGSQTAAYIAGIKDRDATGGVPVFVTANGKLGTSGGVALVTSFNGRVGAVMSQFGDYPPALLGTGTPSDKTFLRGDMTWATPAGGSGDYIKNGTELQTADFNISGTGSATYFAAGTSYKIGGRDVLSGTGKSNIYLGSAGSDYDNGSIRIGTGGFGDGLQNRVFIDALVPNHQGGTSYVTINGYSGELGIGSSPGQDEVIKAQQQQIADLQQRVSRLEALIAKK